MTSIIRVPNKRLGCNRRALFSGSFAAIASIITRPSTGSSDKPQLFRFVAPNQKLRAVAVHNPFGWGVPDSNDPNKYSSMPYRNGYGSWAAAMPSSLLSSIKKVGFDAIRLTVDPGPMMAATDYMTLDALISQVTAAVDDITTCGLRCIVDIHIQSPPSVSGWGDTDVIDGPMGPKFKRLVAIEQRLGSILDTRYSPSAVAFELFNEPPILSAFAGKTAWALQLKYLFEAVRASVPHLTLVVAGMEGGVIGLTALDPSQYDTNTMFSFHSYEPLEFTYQSLPNLEGITYVSRLAFPPNPNHKASAIRAASVAIDVDASLTSIQKLLYKARVMRQLTIYFNTPHDERWIGSVYAPVAKWADNNGIARNRIILGEFGAWGDIGGRLAADLTSRANYLQAARRQAEALGFNWSLWELEAPNSAWKITNSSQALITELVTALGLGRAP